MHPHFDSPFTGGNFRRTFCILGASIGLIGSLASCVEGGQGPTEAGVPLRVEAMIAGSNKTLSLEGRYPTSDVDGSVANALELCGARRSASGSKESVCLSFSQEAMRALTMEMQEQGSYRIRADGKAILHAMSHEITLESDPARSPHGATVRGRATNPQSGVRIDFTVVPGTMDRDVLPAAILAATTLMDPDPRAPRRTMSRESCFEEADSKCGGRGVAGCTFEEKTHYVEDKNGTVTVVYTQSCSYTCKHDQGGAG